MTPTAIKITLKSAATFGSGSGVPGLVDREIEHDAQGFPFLRGKTLKGLLAESAENVVFALEGDDEKSQTLPWHQAKKALFGTGGRGLEERGSLHIGDAQLPAELRAAAKDWSKEDVLYSLTGIRRQTSINEDGGPDHATLRSMRVLLPGVELEAPITFDQDLTPQQLHLLTAAVLDLRRAGTGRNRGRGWVKAELIGGKPMETLFKEFEGAI
jgi:CRISPR/Cas system CSM-associated protein Csm3 (group 7 of RAMP superfamily)